MKKLIEKLQKTFMAAAFAEADCHDTAREIIEAPKTQPTLEEFLDTIGLGGVQYSYVVASL